MKTRTHRYFRYVIAVVFAALSSILLSCSGGEEKKEKDLVTFPLRGEVVKLDKEAMRISVAHEEIPNYMDAMTMPFRVKDSTVFDRLSVGDTIAATLAVSRVESWLEGISVVGEGESRTMSPEDVMFKRLFKEGEPLPELAFINQDGRPFQFSNQKGKVVALTFIYTRCPLPDFCILMSNNFAKIQQNLAKDRDLAGSWQLVTASFDPAFDTPDVLKKYGAQYGADFTTWDFITADMATMKTLASGLDLYVEDGEGGLIDHNLRTVLLDRDGNLVKVIKGNDWTADAVAAEIRMLVKKGKSTS